MKRRLFAVVGYTDWGKSNTLYEIFERRHFFPLKSPILCKACGLKSFIVINASNEDRSTEDYLNRLKEVLEKHSNNDTSFMITVSLIFNNRSHDVNAVFEYLNSLNDFAITYLVLENGWYDKSTLHADDLALMDKKIKHGDIKYFSTMINKSVKKFSERSAEIIKVINQ